VETVCIQALIFRDLVSSALFVSAGLFLKRPDGSLLFAGSRPDEGHWDGHGYFARSIWVLRGSTPVRVKLRKHRWRKVGTSTTCHSRPPEEALSLGACSTIVLLMIWAWLDSPLGLDHKDRREVIDGLERCGSRRTIQRRLHRLLPHALEIQQAIRRAVIERCEPRPVESLFKGGLSPPKALLRRRWKSPSPVERLWRALAILMLGALVLDVPIAHLLAEARGRWDDRDRQCMF
jgi:hypothetical protein